MSYKEALEDGIPVKKDRYGCTWYYPPCHVCRTAVSSMHYLHGVKYTCPDCKNSLAEIAYRKKIETAKERKFQAAVKRIAKVTDIALYESAINKVHSQLDKRGWYQSTEEIMVAIELIHRNVTAHHQAKIFDYKVDFLLPQFKVALEIDGVVYHGKEKQASDIIRDEVVCLALGKGWQVIRIKTDNINTNVTKLIPAIKKVLRYRKTS